MSIAKDKPHEGLIFIITTIRARPRIFGSVKFYVDTGSSISFLSEEDAKRCGAVMRILDFKERTAVGAVPIELAEIQDVTFYFRAEENTSFTIKSKIFKISRRLSSKAEVPFYPSILGCDFLKNNELKLVYDPSRDVAYLEK